MPRLLAPAALLALLAVPAHGQVNQTPDRLYQVEIVVFEQTGNTAETLLFPETPGPAAGTAGPDGTPEPGASTDAWSGRAPETPPEGPPPDEPAPEESAAGDFLPERFAGPLETPQLEGVVRRLESRGYRVIWHQAWTQPASRRAGDAPVDLPVLAALGDGMAIPELSGAVQLSAGRYLHLELELVAPAPGGETYTLAQRRRVKINDLHYFDHPRLGAITVVTVPDVQPEAGATGNPAGPGL